jgi:hypothetical protein
MRLGLLLVVLLFLIAGAEAALAEGHMAVADSLGGLAPLEDTVLAKISGRGTAQPGRPDASRVILWDEEPPRSSARSSASSNRDASEGRGSATAS